MHAKRLTGKSYRYAYAVGIAYGDQAPQPNVLLRHDYKETKPLHKTTAQIM